TLPRSLMATGTTSLRPLSTMARSTRRPMRPNPLMATFTAIPAFPSVRLKPSFYGCGDGLRRDPEVPIEVLIRGGCPETVHPDEHACFPEPALPAEPACRLDADAGGGAKHIQPITLVLLGEQLPAGQRDDGSRDLR